MYIVCSCKSSCACHLILINENDDDDDVTDTKRLCCDFDRCTVGTASELPHLNVSCMGLISILLCFLLKISVYVNVGLCHCQLCLTGFFC